MTKLCVYVISKDKEIEDGLFTGFPWIELNGLTSSVM